MKEFKLTKSSKFFEELGAPSCKKQDYFRNSLLFPSKLEFNRTYYKYAKDKLTAFRILAYAVQGKYPRNGGDKYLKLSYLVQTPSNKPEWIENYIDEDYPIFYSKEDFLRHQVRSCSVDLGWVCGRVAFPQSAYAAVISARGRVWAWDSSSLRPTNDFHPNMDYFVVCPDGVYIGVSDEDYYLSAQDCVKSHLDGMEIDEFAEEPFSIQIDVLPSEQVTHTLRFVEE